MIKTTGIFHIGIPVDDLDRAERFYTQFLGMTAGGRVGEGGARLSRLTCGDATVVLFQRPQPWERTPSKRMASATMPSRWPQGPSMRLSPS